ncbi:MAG: sodium/proton-translocating pyrophosphatase [Chloroflexota bacterium]
MQELSQTQAIMVYSVIGTAILGILSTILLRSQIVAQDTGTARMQELWAYIKAGTNAYLSSQLRTLLLLSVVGALLLGASVLVVPPTSVAIERFGEQNTVVWVSVGRAVAGIVGALVVYLAAFLGTRLAAEGTVRVAAAARKGYFAALRVAYWSAMVTGILGASFGLLGVVICFLVFGVAVSDILIGFVLGSSLAVLLLRLGGGVFTETTRFGTEQDTPAGEDDPQELATLSRTIGEQSGHTAGTSSDGFESLEIATIAALILGIGLGLASDGNSFDPRYMLFPIIVRGIGILASLLGNIAVRTDERRRNALAAMSRGLYVAAILALIGVATVVFFLMADPTTNVVDWRPFLAVLTGVVLVLLLGRITEFFTATQYSPVKQLSHSSRSGPASNILSGIASSFEASVWSVIVSGMTVLSAVFIYINEPAATQPLAIFYGVALSGVGMLSLSGNITSMGVIGVVCQSASTIGSLAGIDKNARNVMDDLRAVGATTMASTKGILTSASLVSVIALLGALLHTAGLLNVLSEQTTFINLGEPLTLLAVLVGSIISFLCTSFVLRAITRASVSVSDEVQRQRQTMSSSDSETAAHIDYARIINVATQSSQRELLGLILLVIVLPVLLGFWLGVAALSGFILGALISTFSMAFFQNNAGSAWQNAQRYIEDGNVGGKYSDAHSASMVGASVGDSLKNAAGSATGVVVKIMSLTALLITPTVLVTGGLSPLVMGVISVCSVLLITAIVLGRRGGAATTESRTRTGTARRV